MATKFKIVKKGINVYGIKMPVTLIQIQDLKISRLEHIGGCEGTYITVDDAKGYFLVEDSFLENCVKQGLIALVA